MLVICRLSLLNIFLFTFCQFFSLEYKVKSGDTLWSISKKFNIPSNVISSMNQLQAVMISRGQLLYIPEGLTRYTVKKGDNLSKIARYYNVKVDTVRIINKLENENVREGQVLILPTGVKSHESLQVENPQDYMKDKKFIMPAEMGDVKQVKNKGRGVIVFLNENSKIKSIGNGIVKFSGRINGYNNVIVIYYGGDLFAVYGYLGERLVKEGETVSLNQVIGSAGNVEKTGSPGVYFEVRNGRKNLNVLELYPALSEKEIAFDNIQDNQCI